MTHPRALPFPKDKGLQAANRETAAVSFNILAASVSQTPFALAWGLAETSL